jgi:choline dehydrogenase-like flavoprotein
VDRDCSVFELPNLFIASSATFCTNSHANPTLTIVAFAIRLAEHLKKTGHSAGWVSLASIPSDSVS